MFVLLIYRITLINKCTQVRDFVDVTVIFVKISIMFCMLRMTDAHLVCSVYKLTFFIRVVFLRLEMSASPWLYVGISINANLYNLYNY